MDRVCKIFCDVESIIMESRIYSGNYNPELHMV